MVNIADVDGQEVYKNVFSAAQGSNSFKVVLSDVKQGVYSINITDENGVPLKNDKLIIIK